MADHGATAFRGSDEDRVRLMELHQAYLDANLTMDNDAVRKLWSDDPNCVFFNSNGFTYHGIEQWTKLWDHYRPLITFDEPFRSSDVRLIGTKDMAVVTCERTAKIAWTGAEPAPAVADRTWLSKTTEVFVREGDDWRCVHIHVSASAEGPRPGGI